MPAKTVLTARIVPVNAKTLSPSKDIPQALGRLFAPCGFSWDSYMLESHKTVEAIDDVRDMMEELIEDRRKEYNEKVACAMERNSAVSEVGQLRAKLKKAREALK